MINKQITLKKKLKLIINYITKADILLIIKIEIIYKIFIVIIIVITPLINSNNNPNNNNKIIRCKDNQHYLHFIIKI